MSAREHLIMATLLILSTFGAAVLAQSIFTPDIAGCERASPPTMGALEVCPKAVPIGQPTLQVS